MQVHRVNAPNVSRFAASMRDAAILHSHRPDDRAHDHQDAKPVRGVDDSEHRLSSGVGIVGRHRGEDEAGPDEAPRRRRSSA
jgi:hypothetical protein